MDANYSLPTTLLPPPLSRTSRKDALDIADLLPQADWLRLPASLRRRFAPSHRPATYDGTLTIRASWSGTLFAVLARLFGAPLPTVKNRVPVSVCDRTTSAGIEWSRRVGAAQLVRSVKSAGPGGTVLERTDGGLGMVLGVSVEDGALVFTSRSYFLAVGRWCVRLPALMTPGRCRVEHRALDETRFRFTLSMVHPLWGTTFRQDGVFIDEEHLP